MAASGQKQPTLKPQDLLVVLKLCVSEGGLGYSALAQQLSISQSEVHAAVRRASLSYLLSRNRGDWLPHRASVREFLIHGVKFVFPLVLGPLSRGLPTGVSAPPLLEYFEHTDALPLVWPDEHGHVRGVSVIPLYPSVPMACKRDEKLYRLLSLVDALRGGAARERKVAQDLLERVIK